MLLKAAIPAILLALPSVLVGQERASLNGTVTDESSRPVARAYVTLPQLQRAVTTDSAGQYHLRDLPTGRVILAIRAIGRRPASVPLDLAAGPNTHDAVLPAATLDMERVTITARRVEEVAQDVPIPVAVLTGKAIDNAGAFNVNRLQQSVPSLQFYTTNPRNSFLNIRGLGLPFGLANDGIEPGVGMYVDGVFHSRPAAATLDFLDVDRIEVLRGPQGTLFGKNTTAGALNVTTRKPNLLHAQGTAEVSTGNLGFMQTKASFTGPFRSNLAGRLSVSVTQRDGVLQNVRTGEDVNTLDNVGGSGQLLFLPIPNLVLTVAGDYSRQRPNGYAPVVVGVAPTRRNANRQFPRIASDLGYALPSNNPFDRLIDTNTPWRSDQDYGGGSLTADWTVGPGQLTAITAWRFWDWDPSNDRDFTGLSVTSFSGAPSLQKQWTQEVRYAAKVSPTIDFVAGAFGFHQTLDGKVRLENGPDSWRWSLSPSAAAATPGLLTGLGSNALIDFTNESAALFGQLQWAVTDRLRVLPGIRLNYDRKEGRYDQQVYGGLQTADPALLAIKAGIARPAAYAVDTDDTNLSGQFTVGYQVTSGVNTYATYATSFKSVGLNIAGGLPSDPRTGQPDVSIAVVPPEDERHVEVGIKTSLRPGLTANINAYNTTVNDYQTQVFTSEAGVVRGYLANAEQVRVRGVELEGGARVSDRLTFNGSAAYADGRHARFTGAPASLEGTGGPQIVDISGSRLAGLSKWSLALGGDYRQPVGRTTDLTGGFDVSYRSKFSSSTTPSQYLVVDGYSVLNGRVGVQVNKQWSVTVWSRNLLNRDYYEQLAAVTGGTGLYVGFLGDPRTFGVTLRRTP